MTIAVSSTGSDYAWLGNGRNFAAGGSGDDTLEAGDGDDWLMGDTGEFLFYPDGRTLQAVGMYPEVTSRGLPEIGEGDHDRLDPSSVTFDKPVYFVAPDGGPVIVNPGTYIAEAAPPCEHLRSAE